MTARPAPLDRIALWLAAGAVPPCPHEREGLCRLCAAVKAEVVKAMAASEVFAEPA